MKLSNLHHVLWTNKDHTTCKINRELLDNSLHDNVPVTTKYSPEIEIE